MDIFSHVKYLNEDICLDSSRLLRATKLPFVEILLALTLNPLQAFGEYKKKQEKNFKRGGRKLAEAFDLSAIKHAVLLRCASVWVHLSLSLSRFPFGKSVVFAYVG